MLNIWTPYKVRKVNDDYVVSNDFADDRRYFASKAEAEHECSALNLRERLLLAFNAVILLGMGCIVGGVFW